MSSNYVHNNDDPIVEIFNAGHPEDNDIQVINRDNHDPFDSNFVSPNMSTPSIHHNQLYNEYDNNQQQQGSTSQAQTQQLKDESTGFTSMLGSVSDFAVSHANNQLATINQPNYITPLPPLPPLSESVIPNGLSIQPLALQSKSSIGNGGMADSNQERKPISMKKKKESSGPKARPAFVMKIWSMVNDPSNKEYIRWNEDGKTFQVFHREEFMKLILPKYFKHNNFASFVRQLNMYGWHKVQDINSGTLNQNKDDKSSEEIWQFENPYFIKDREDLLDKIVRNKSVNQENDTNDVNQINFSLILNELDQIKMNQLAISEDLRRVRKDNKTLWHENYITRERHQQQAQTLEKILKFLAAVYGNNAGKFLEVDNAPFDINDLSNNNQMTTYNFQQQPQQQTQSKQTSANPYTQQPPSPFHKPRLMLMNQAHKRSPSSSNNKSSISSTHRDGNTSNSGSIEEIIRSYEASPNGGSRDDNIHDAPQNNVNRIYQQIINQDPQISSPRHFFPELNNASNSPYLGPGTPGTQFARLGASAESLQPSNSNELMNGLEQNIYKQSQSIQQVQDWIQKLANQQQQQQLQHQAVDNENNDDLKQDLDEFDVNEFLNNNSTSNTSNPVIITPANSEMSSGNKRSIEELFDGEISSGSNKKKSI